MSTINTPTPITNSQLRADAEVTRKMSFAGKPFGGSVQSERVYIPAGSVVTVDFGKRLGQLAFQMGDAPAWSDVVIAAIRRSTAFKTKMAERKTKAEPVISYTGRTLKRPEQPKLEPKAPKFPQPGALKGMA